MSDQLEWIPGSTRDVALSQYLTPPKLAERVVEWAGIPESFGHHGTRMYRVLEPSAGNGALVRPLVAAGAHVHAVELDLRYVSDIANALGLGKHEHRMDCPHDFLEMRQPLDRGYPIQFDLCVMNPPYHDDNESKFVLHALEFAPRVVGIFRADIFYTVTRGEGLWKAVRPTRVAFCSRRPWKGAETDYCVLELVKRSANVDRYFDCDPCTLEWWPDKWF